MEGNEDSIEALQMGAEQGIPIVQFILGMKSLLSKEMLTVNIILHGVIKKGLESYRMKQKLLSGG
jgi:hypothetical protein